MVGLMELLGWEFFRVDLCVKSFSGKRYVKEKYKRNREMEVLRNNKILEIKNFL